MQAGLGVAMAWAAACLLSVPAGAQISLSTAVNLALGNDSRVRLAQADLLRAKAVMAETKDAFVPAVVATGGVGKSTGAPLSPPVVFNIASQSLVYSASQGDYIRAARAGMESAQLALDAARSDVAEDVVTTYVTLDNALERRAVQRDALGFAGSLVRVTEERFEAGVDTHLELTKGKRTEAQIRLAAMLVEDEIATQGEHLAQLTGLPARGLETVHGTIPTMRPPAPGAEFQTASTAQLTANSAAFAAARAKQFTARGDGRYLLRPQIAFSANYARISTAFTSYTQYYPRYGADNNSFNSLSLGVQITLPLLDMVHRAKARETAAEAAHSLYEARVQQVLFLESRSKLRRSTAELQVRRDLADLEHDLAEDQLNAMTARLQASAGVLGGEQMTPKDEANARLGERQRRLDVLNAALQLEQTEVTLMRQEGSLSGWLAASLPGMEAVPASAGAGMPGGAGAPGGLGVQGAAAEPVVPATVGVSAGAAGSGAAGAGATGVGAAGYGVPPVAPTMGTSPAGLPGSPLTTPVPADGVPVPTTGTPPVSSSPKP